MLRLTEELAVGIPLREARDGLGVVLESVQSEKRVEHVPNALVGHVHEQRVVHEVAAAGGCRSISQ